MSSVGDDARRSLAASVRGLSPEERLLLTARLAAFDLELYCAAHGVSPEEGRRRLQRRRQAGRTRSAAAEGLLE